MLHSKTLLIACAFVTGAAAAVVHAASVYELKNNQPFSLHTPVIITPQQPLPDGAWKIDESTMAQSLNGALHLLAEIPAKGEKQFALGTLENMAVTPEAPPLAVFASGGNVALRFNKRDLGRLSWGLVLRPLATTSKGTEQAPKLPFDYKGEFSALPLDFKKVASGPVFDLWKGSADKSGLSCIVMLRVYHAGFLDLETSLTNRSANPDQKVYCALVCRWEQAEAPKRTIDYDNHINVISDNAYSHFRLGTERHLFIQRGTDWIRSDYKDGVSVTWMNEFSDSFTLLDKSSKNTFKQPRYVGGSLPQLGQEIQTSGSALYSITEIARPNIRSYSPDRIFANVLPSRGEGVSFSSRMRFMNSPPDDADTTQMFLGYTSVRSQSSDGEATCLAWGVPHVRFGTAYFPYSTLGENFDRVKLPGMDREAFWPLAADTVLRWREFADEIRRDLRIAKGMGFELIRLHHIELLSAIPAETRREYLDFLFNEMRHLGLKAMVDVYGTPESIAELVKRHGDVIDTVEIENEILIWGIPMDRPEQWKAIYKAVKDAAPHVRVHLTCHTNTAMFERLDKLGVPYDNVSMHTYIDSVDALPSGRGFALATASRATKENKPAVVTEWNWRNVTRLAPARRAEFTYKVFDSALSTRSISEMHQFQFNETMTPNPRAGRGNILRHYELIHLSRRIKLDGAAFMLLIKKYSGLDNAVHSVEAAPTVVVLTSEGEGSANITIKNITHQPMHLNLSLETPGDLQASMRSDGSGQISQTRTLALQPGESIPVDIDLKTTGTAPGFYHGFIRIEGEGKLLRYTWIEARLAGQPRMNTAAESKVIYPRGAKTELDIDFTKPCVVVYAHDSSVLEAETAIAIAGTLESATGCPVDALSSDTLTPAHRSRMTIIAVGTNEKLLGMASIIGVTRENLRTKERSYVQSLASADATPPTLVIGGADAIAAEEAGMDFLLRYWMHAKNSAARRVGLVEKVLPRGGDPVKLP